jgi:hypothetical protein
MSRAAWLALGSCAVAASGTLSLGGCSSQAPTGIVTAPDAAADVATADTGPDVGPGHFACGSNACADGQICQRFHDCNSPKTDDTCSDASETTFANACGATPSCACIESNDVYNGMVTCAATSGHTEVDYVPNSGCGGCYGAPPARLERLA